MCTMGELRPFMTINQPDLNEHLGVVDIRISDMDAQIVMLEIVTSVGC